MTIRPIAQTCILVITLLLAAGAAGAQTILDFEDADIPTGATIVAQYGARGVIFQHASLESDPAAHSGTRVLRAVKTGSEVFTPLPMVITFTSAQTA